MLSVFAHPSCLTSSHEPASHPLTQDETYRKHTHNS